MEDLKSINTTRAHVLKLEMALHQRMLHDHYDYVILSADASEDEVRMAVADLYGSASPLHPVITVEGAREHGIVAAGHRWFALAHSDHSIDYANVLPEYVAELEAQLHSASMHPEYEYGVLVLSTAAGTQLSDWPRDWGWFVHYSQEGNAQFYTSQETLSLHILRRKPDQVCAVDPNTGLDLIGVEAHRSILTEAGYTDQEINHLSYPYPLRLGLRGKAAEAIPPAGALYIVDPQPPTLWAITGQCIEFYLGRFQPPQITRANGKDINPLFAAKPAS